MKLKQLFLIFLLIILFGGCSIQIDNLQNLLINDSLISDNYTWSSYKITSIITSINVSSKWSNNSNDIYYNSGNVGIGTETPSAYLHINSSSSAIIKLFADSDNVGESDNPTIQLKQDGEAVGFDIGLGGNPDEEFTDSLLNVAYLQNIGATSGIQLATSNQARITILDAGNIGIGTITPNAELSVNGVIESLGGSYTGTGTSADTKTDVALIIPYNTQIYGLTSNQVSLRRLIGTDGTGASNINIGQGATALIQAIKLFAGNSGFISLSSGGGEAMRIISNKNVGIGVTNPSYPLEVGAHSTNISIYSENQISATGYITRTSVYDKSLGSALDKVRDSDDYKDSKGKIDHDKFAGFIEYQTPDKTRPVITEREIVDDLGDKILINETTYPYTITQEGVSLDVEIDVLRQAIYELKTELCIYKNYSWC